MSHNQEEKHTLSRREALKTLAAITGAVSLASLPNKWESPLVEVGALPAHAQSSTTAAIRARNTGSQSVTAILFWPNGSSSNTQTIPAGQSYTWNGLAPINVSVTGARDASPCYYLTWIVPGRLRLSRKRLTTIKRFAAWVLATPYRLMFFVTPAK